MIQHLMSNLGASLIDAQVPRVDILIDPSMITLETIWNRGDGNLVSQQRVLMNTLYHDPSLANYFMAYEESRNKSRIIVRGMATPNHDIYPTAPVKKVAVPVRLNFIALHINPSTYAAQAQIVTAIEDSYPYVHGVRLYIRQGTPVTQVSTALRDTLQKVMTQHKNASSKIPHCLVVQRIYPRLPREVDIVSHTGDYENTIVATVDSLKGYVPPTLMQLSVGSPLRKPRYGK